VVDAPARHPGIGLVCGVEKGRHVIVTPRGTAALTPERLPRGLSESEQTVRDLARVLSFPHSGDLILLGAWMAQGRRVVSFEDQHATHGGAGGPQAYPFFLTPPEAPLDLSAVTSARELYPGFSNGFTRDRRVWSKAVRGRRGAR